MIYFKKIFILGLYIDFTFNGFLIDIIVFVIFSGFQFVSFFSFVLGIQFYRILMKVKWLVNDVELYIERQYFFIKFYIGGEFDLFFIKVKFFLVDICILVDISISGIFVI